MSITGSGKSKSGKNFDESFSKLAVVGFEAGMSLEERLSAMKLFMEKNFPKVDARYTIIHRGSWKEKGKHRTMTKVGLIDISCPDLRESLMRSIDSKGLKVHIAGKNLNVARAKSQSARDRDDALFKAADLMKKQPDVTETYISIKRGDNRK